MLHAFCFTPFCFLLFALRFTLFTFHQRLEIRKCDQLTNFQTYRRTWVGARDTCVSKKSTQNVYFPRPWETDPYICYIYGTFWHKFQIWNNIKSWCVRTSMHAMILLYKTLHYGEVVMENGNWFLGPFWAKVSLSLSKSLSFA